MRTLNVIWVLAAIFINVAATAAEQIYFVQTDHLGAPEMLTDENQTIVWQASQDPFANSAPITEQVTFDFRFPGQYYDAESGLFYNWNRYYDAGLGRYVTSDPIGLRGGLNTFGYVGGNPLLYSDPTGESAAHAIRGSWAIGGHVGRRLIGPAINAGISGIAGRPTTLGGAIFDALNPDPLTMSPADADAESEALQCSDSGYKCDPPEGTICSEFHEDLPGSRPHRVTNFEGEKLDEPQGNHVHTWQMNKTPHGCIWNKRRQVKYTFNYTPVNARACSSYPSWVAQKGL